MFLNFLSLRQQLLPARLSNYCYHVLKCILNFFELLQMVPGKGSIWLKNKMEQLCRSIYHV